MSDAGVGDVLDLAHQQVIPSSALLPGLPVERSDHGTLEAQTQYSYETYLTTVKKQSGVT
jgi:hypothetical protein